jgi:hypothetical protein
LVFIFLINFSIFDASCPWEGCVFNIS